MNLRKIKLTTKKMKLATKMSIIIGMTLFLIFLILNVFSIRYSHSAITTAIDGEFAGIATQNGLLVQRIIDDASDAALNLQDYIESEYLEYEQKTFAVSADGELISEINKKSNFYDVQLSEVHYETEKYILNNAWSLVKNNPDIIGMGVFFEPYKYDKAIKDYTLYIGENEAANHTVQSYGSYSDYGSQNYYTQAATTMTPYFTQPYVDQGVQMITASYPIVYKNELQGITTVDINVDNFSNIKTSDDKYKTMFATIYSDDGTIIYDSVSKNKTNKNAFDFMANQGESQKMKNLTAEGQPFTISATTTDGKYISRYFYPIDAQGKTWWAETSLEVSDLNKEVHNLIFMMIGISVAAFVLIIAITTILLRKQLNPINEVVLAATNIANGDLNINIDIKSEDEIGILAHTFKGMAENLKAIIDDINNILGEMADGNFQVNLSYEDRYIGDYRNILIAIYGINRNLSSTLSNINQASDQVSSGSDQVSSGAQALSQGAIEQASSIEELSATINEISLQIKDNAENAQFANKLSSEAGNVLSVGSQQMKEMVHAIEEISTSSNEIGKIIKTIDDIAFQTNILALNAAVEASRAGAAGKGFAVVAEEVRNLAQKSAEAAKNTTVMIESAVNSVGKGIEIADETAKSITEVVTSASQVNDIVQKIASASEKQADTIIQITQGVDQVSSVVQTNSATAEESAAASEELSGQAQMLKQLVGKFKLNN